MEDYLTLTQICLISKHKNTFLYAFIKNFEVTQQFETMGTSEAKHLKESSKVRIFIYLLPLGFQKNSGTKFTVSIKPHQKSFELGDTRQSWWEGEMYYGSRLGLSILNGILQSSQEN